MERGGAKPPRYLAGSLWVWSLRTDSDGDSLTHLRNLNTGDLIEARNPRHPLPLSLLSPLPPSPQPPPPFLSPPPPSSLFPLPLSRPRQFLGNPDQFEVLAYWSKCQ